MNVAQIENNLQLLVKSFDEQSFIYDLMLSYGQPKASIKRLKDGGLNLSKNNGEILWKKKLFFKETKDTDLHDLIDNLRIDDAIAKHSPRFIIVTDYKNLVARDTKTNDTLDIEILEIPRYFDFFLPLAGMEKAQHQFENPADVKAAERMGKLYDQIKKDNPTDTEEEVHNLNVFLTRLLFCFFAEDTNIFEKSQFTHSLVNHTQDDGSDLHTHFERLFEVMNTEDNQRGTIPVFLNSFPYVNGGLFRNHCNIPLFSRKSRQVIIESGELDWSAINPDIFGSMIQTVITPEHRGGLGMHYTSVPNIMKVIDPLFLNDFYEEFEESKGNLKRLRQLLNRIWNTKYFDPACGSGNFLIIAYKELRKLEMKIFKELNEIALSNITLNQFYGIELDDFAHEVAILSLWLAEHQMNQLFFNEFGRSKPPLPLTSAGNIVHGNACQLNWESICPKSQNDEIYLFGNPPFVGFLQQSQSQKNDIDIVFGELKTVRKLDYVSCWFYLSSNYILNSNIKFAFVSTNSLTQGEQVSLLWPYILENRNIEIFFAHTSFKWTNNAKKNAGVSCVILGFRNISPMNKYIYSEGLKFTAKNINAYLADANNIYIYKRTSQLSKLPEISLGSSAYDGGFLMLTKQEYVNLISDDTRAKELIKKFVGSDEFINSIERYCLWIPDDKLEMANEIDFIRSRLNSVENFRKKSNRGLTFESSKTPHHFTENRHQELPSILIPIVSSERREYYACGFLKGNEVIPNSARAIYNPEPYIFSILSSKLHMLWIRAVAGQLETRLRYSAGLCYNSFPIPSLTQNQKEILTTQAYKIIDAREIHSELTIAQLYDPEKMPTNLLQTHKELDKILESFYKINGFNNDEERLSWLFKLYEQMIEEEKSKGTLFEMESKPKKKKK
jgi:hypothetical protein